ncbi:zinc finger, CCHC-type containing protein [Tanacetum coccineum]|uniref:Zinc finger, CCHC-type containing protein n=1 Tax=Tanacetum coccineum TaxID=301880 RepID=A0ABQ4Z044_9ASTR
MEKKCKPSISHHRAWLKSVKRLSMKNMLGKKEPVSKHGRKSTKPGPTLDAFDDLNADLAHGMDYMDTEEVVTEGRQSKETEELNVTHDTEVLEKGGSNEEPVNAAGNIGVSTAFNISTASRPEVSTATPMTPPTTSTVFEDEDIFLVDALVMLSDKEKLKGVEIKEKKDAERPAILVLTLKPLPIIDPKDKGKGVLEEEPEPVKVKSKDQGEAQIKRDAEITLKEKYTVDERAKLLTEYFENRKKQLLEERAAAIKNKPPTKSQLRSLMMTYLKHTGRYKHAHLNKKTLEEIQVLYIKEHERIADFVPISKEAVEAPGSQPVANYLKHKINEKLIKGLVNNNIFNNSRSRTQAGKKRRKEYKVLPWGPAYDAILKKLITKKEDTGGNFEIPCSIGNLKHVNALVDQGFDVNVMPYSTYMKLTDKRPTKTDIRLSLASHSYIYPLGIAEDVLVKIAEHVYLVDFMILDVRENKNRPFILGTPFLTTAKASIKFDTGTITLRSGKHKVSPGIERKDKTPRGKGNAV